MHDPENSSDLYPVSRLAAVDQIVFEDNIDGARKLTWRRVFRHLLDGDGLRILINAVAILHRKRIIIIIFCRNCVVELAISLGICLLRQIVLIIIVFDQSPLGILAVVHRGLDSGAHKCDSGNDTLHLHHFVHEI